MAADEIDQNSIIGIGSGGVTYQDLYSATLSGAPYTFTTNGTGAAPWISVNDHNTLSVSGDADFNGEVRVQGRSLADFMQQVEQRLNILQLNPELEAEWDELRELGDRYRELEQQCKEKSQMWKTLKK
jgi:hypothetical protein